jgi:hypothetical protein
LTGSSTATGAPVVHPASLKLKVVCFLPPANTRAPQPHGKFAYGMVDWFVYDSQFASHVRELLAPGFSCTRAPGSWLFLAGDPGSGPRSGTPGTETESTRPPPALTSCAAAAAAALNTGDLPT